MYSLLLMSLIFFSTYSSAKSVGDINEDTKLIYDNYKIKESDLGQIEYGMTCDGDFPKPKNQKAVRADVTKKLVTKDFTIPANSLISFCNGKIQGISSTDEIKIWDYKCKGKVEAEGYSYEVDQEMYSCPLSSPLTIDGVDLPSDVKVVFTKKNLVCFYAKEIEDPVIVAGVKIDSSSAYRIRKKKVVQIKDCMP